MKLIVLSVTLLIYPFHLNVGSNHNESDDVIIIIICDIYDDDVIAIIFITILILHEINFIMTCFD